MDANEVEIIRKIKSKEQQALADLYALYGGKVYNTALYILRSRMSAEEVTQDVFMQVWRWPERWNPDKAKLLTWMLVITRYAAIDRLRKEQRRPQLANSTLGKIEHLLPTHVPPDGNQQETGRLLRGLIAQLPKNQRQIIQLTYFQGMTHTEVADHLEIPLGTVKSRMRLGIQRLRDLWWEATREGEL